MENLQRAIEELKKVKMDFAGPPTAHELPKRPFGVFVEPTIDLKIGLRKIEFTDEEKVTKDTVIMRRDTAAESAMTDSNEEVNNRHSRMSVGETLGLGGKFYENGDIMITRL